MGGKPNPRLAIKSLFIATFCSIDNVRSLFTWFDVVPFCVVSLIVDHLIDSVFALPIKIV